MYLFDYKQFSVVTVGLSLSLVIGSLLRGIPTSFAQDVLIAAGLFVSVVILLSSLLGKKLVVFSTFISAIFVSFSHFLLNFSKDPLLVPLVYSFSILTLFVLLVTNFQEKQLIEQ